MAALAALVTAGSIVTSAIPSESVTSSDAAVAAARSRFARAGLALPDDVDVVFDTKLRTCAGERGRYHHDPVRPRIVVCGSPTSDPTHRVLLHEFGHAWDRANLSDDDRARLLDEWGLTHWWAGDERWVRLGAERAAEIISWGVRDGHVPAPWVGFRSCDELDARYRRLTGKDPPAAHPSWCRIPRSSGPLVARFEGQPSNAQATGAR